ncbi:iron-sulfur cluster assembly scaffold protein [Candidatus Dependentiae bacterium]|nr:iron-sulfur cluster assembly scaffold protein [Candidatus Dependentiae bacterium]
MALIDNRLLVDHAKNPRFYELLHSPSHQKTIKNMSCGDAVTVSLHLVDGIISAVGFSAEGCMLCRAATSIFLCNIKGMQVLNVLALTEENLLDMLESREISHGRRRCAMLGFEAVQAMLGSS